MFYCWFPCSFLSSCAKNYVLNACADPAVENVNKMMEEKFLFCRTNNVSFGNYNNYFHILFSQKLLISIFWCRKHLKKHQFFVTEQSSNDKKLYIYLLIQLDLNSELAWYSDKGDLFAYWRVFYSDAQYHESSVFRSTFG